MANKYAKGPFRADVYGGIIFNADGFHFADVRGWGALQHLEKTEEEAAKAQDTNLQYMLDALNEKWERENRCKAVWRAGVLQAPGEKVIPDGTRCSLAPHSEAVPHKFKAKNG